MSLDGGFTIHSLFLERQVYIFKRSFISVKDIDYSPKVQGENAFE
jgi:hypothetical protein